MKVYFGADGEGISALHEANVKYILLSFYHHEKLTEAQQQSLMQYKNIMIDSGLFTYMWGAEAGTDITVDFCNIMQKNYIEYLKKYFTANDIAVEMDVQKKLGSEVAWELRRKLKRELKNQWGGSLINVYHLEDGNPDALINEADYIAISQPELRRALSKKERIQITSYIASRAMAKGKRVHLLGLTETWFMKLFRHCTSCDSTSWQSHFRWGGEVAQEWKILKDTVKGQPLKYRTRPLTDRYWAGVFFLEEYKRYAGDQS